MAKKVKKIYARSSCMYAVINNSLSPYQAILNKKLCGQKQTTLASFFIKPVTKKSVMEEELKDPQPLPSGLQLPVMV
jgi:hypothetical protein